MSRVVLSDLSDNKVVMPTNVSKFDRNRERTIVFYGRVSTSMRRNSPHSKIKCNGMMTKQNTIQIGMC